MDREVEFFSGSKNIDELKSSTKFGENLRLVLFAVVQVMSDISKQDYTYNNVPNENLHSSSIALITSRNHQITLITVNYIRPPPKTTVYENTNLYRMYYNGSPLLRN